MAEQRNIPADLVEIGTLARPHGIRGEIRVNYYADSLELLRGDVVYLQAGNKPPRKMEIDTVRMHQGTPLIRFVEAPDRTAAEFLRGQTLLIPESALPELDEDEVYLHDMLGLSVVLACWITSFSTESRNFGPSSRRKARKSCFPPCPNLSRTSISIPRSSASPLLKGCSNSICSAFTAVTVRPHLTVESWPFPLRGFLGRGHTVSVRR